MSRRFLANSCIVAAFIANALCFAANGVAQEFDEQFAHWPVDLKINGRIVVDNGAGVVEERERFLESLGSANSIAFFHDESTPESRLSAAIREQSNENGSVESFGFDRGFPAGELKSALAESDIVILQAGTRFRRMFEELSALKPEFDSFIDNGGTLVADRSTAELLGKYYVKLDATSQTSQISSGLNLLPDCVLRCEFDNSDDSNAEVLGVLAKHPRCIGVKLEHESMLVLSGRKMTCYGAGEATFMLMANERVPLRIRKLRGRRNRVDLTQWRLDAIDRTLDAFPAAEPGIPFLENGALVIVGGGGMPRGLMSRFVELAGGVENAKLVYVPCSEADNLEGPQRTVESWKRMGVQSATFIHTKDRNKANSDDEFLAPLRDATGIWFGGGRQWNLADSYYGTEAHRLMKEVLQRGGVVGGSSAGASIQARYLARANAAGNLEIIAPGYERGGLGFISGVAIDQHFSQRNRQKDMTQLVDKYPQLLGIGLDEATAIVVQKSKAEVVGRGRAHFFDRQLPVYPNKPDFIALPHGSSYDLAERKALSDASDDVPDSASAPVFLVEGRKVSVDDAQEIDDVLWVTAKSLQTLTGYTIKPEGACAEDVCVPISEEVRQQLIRTAGNNQWLQLELFLSVVNQPYAVDKEEQVWSLGRRIDRLANSELGFADDFALRDRSGKLVRLTDFRGKKVILMTWASW